MGIAVHIGARVAAWAEPDEVLVSSTVKDLRLMNGSYHAWYSTHVFNGTFLRLIDYALKKRDMK